MRVVDVGNLVGANDANGIAVITRLSPIDVEFSIPQDRVPEVQTRLASGARVPVAALDRTRTNVLELNLPAANAAVPDLPEGLDLEVIVRKDTLEVADRKTGLLKSLQSTDKGYDLAGLSDYLQLVKSKYPDKQNATILLEGDIAYDTLVQVMDTVRVFDVPNSNHVRAELFPDVSVGDAPT